MNNYSTLNVSLNESIATVTLNRPDKANAMNEEMWQEIRQAMLWADETPEVRVVILSGEGKNFSAGIDLGMLLTMKQKVEDQCQGRTSEKMRQIILDLQSCITSLEECRKPVIASIQGACIGGALDLVTAADMRYCSSNARFSIKEIELGMVADVGTLQRLPKLVPAGIVREWAYTGKMISAEKAEKYGLVNAVCETTEELYTAVLEIAQDIADKSPLSIRGTKEMLNYTRDHTVADALKYIATWNSGMLISEDIQKGMEASLKKEKADFRN